MKKIEIDSGVQEYEIGKAVVTFNPVDIFFLERVDNAVERIQSLFMKYQQQTEAIEVQYKDDDAQAGRKIFKIGREIDGEMRKIIDDLFDQKDVSKDIFGTNTSLFAITKNGLPIAINLLLAIRDEMCEAIEAAKAAQKSEKTQEYLNKYQ